MAQQQHSAPFGNIFYVNTPNIDRFSEQLYAEQRQREASQQQQAKELDNELRKNVANIKDADVGDYVNKYNEYKDLSKQLMNTNPSDSKAYLAKQMEKQKKLAEVYSLAAGSKDAKDEENVLFKDMLAHPEAYEDNAYELLSKRKNTRLQDLGDLSDINTFRYKGTDFDLQKAMETAGGKPAVKYTEENPVQGDALSRQITPYSYGNAPLDYKNSLMGSFYTHKGGRFAAHAWDQIPPETKQAIEQEFQSIPADKWKKMGLEGPQDLEPKNPDSKPEQFASYMAKMHAINSVPTAGVPQMKKNEEAAQNATLSRDITLENIKQANRQANMARQNAYNQGMVDYRKSTNKVESDGIINNFIDKQIENSDAARDITLDGKKYSGKLVAVPKTIADKYAIDDPNYAVKQKPSAFLITNDKKYFIPIYPSTTKNSDNKADIENPQTVSGNYKFDRTKTKIEPIEGYKGLLGSAWLQKKSVGGEIDNQFADDEDAGAAPPPPKTKNTKGTKLQKLSW